MIYVQIKLCGDVFYYKDPKHTILHRRDGPAVIRQHGEKFSFFWYRKGKLHRKDGPAIMYFNGLNLWFWKGKRVSQEEHAKILEIPKKERENKKYNKNKK